MPGQKKIESHAPPPFSKLSFFAFPFIFFPFCCPFLFFRSSCPFLSFPFLSCFYISKSFAVLQTFFATQIQLPCAIELPCFKAAKRCFHVLRLKRRTPKHVLTALKPDFASVMQTSSRHSSSRMSEWYARSEKKSKAMPLLPSLSFHFLLLPSFSFLFAAPSFSFALPVLSFPAFSLVKALLCCRHFLPHRSSYHVL